VLLTRRISTVSIALTPGNTMNRPDYHTGRSQMLLEAGSEDYSTILSSPIGIRAAARWLTRSGALHQFMLAKEMLARTDREEGLRSN